ncbi:hypothetical protein D3C76_1252710 [compost metagenome]
MANPLKLSPQWIENQVLTEEYLIRGGRFMVCIIYTRGGYYVTGESAPINPAEFTEELGKKYSREEALDKIWRIEGIIARKQHYGDDSEVLESVSNGHSIAVGDTVYLNSGGPKLTVEEIVTGKATCSWYDSNNDCKQHVKFDVACLTHTDPKVTA